MKGRKWVKIHVEAHTGGRGADGNSLRARTGRAQTPTSRGANTASGDWWEWARTDGQRRRRMDEAQMRRALTDVKGHRHVRPGADFCCNRAGLGADSSRGRMVPDADSSRESGCKRDHCNRAWTGFETHTTTAKRTLVGAWTGDHQAKVRTGARWNGCRHYAGACGCQRGARGYGHGGINKTPTYFVFAKLSIRISSLSKHA
jgi:hypothetical protein